MAVDRSPTLKEIADVAGVSIATVSSALNDRPTVAAETRARVVDIAVSLGYRPKGRGPLRQAADIGVIGLLTKHDLGMTWEINRFYSRVQLGVTNTGQRHHISVMIANIEVDESNHPVIWPTMIDEQQIDGLILAGTFIDDTVHVIRRRSDIPMVLVDSYAPDLELDSVVTDNLGGAQKAVRHLIAHGHRRIGLAGWNPLSPPSIQQRKQAYMTVLAEHGLEPFIVETKLFAEGGAAAVKALLRDQRQVTALFCCNDETAFGALDEARALGLRVPDDLSVIGFDNLEESGKTNPALTTIHVHKSWMGSLSVEMLMERIRHPERPKITVVVSTHLVERDTVGPARG